MLKYEAKGLNQPNLRPLMTGFIINLFSQVLGCEQKMAAVAKAQPLDNLCHWANYLPTDETTNTGHAAEQAREGA